MEHFELIRNRWENGYGFIIFILYKMGVPMDYSK